MRSRRRRIIGWTIGGVFLASFLALLAVSLIDETAPVDDDLRVPPAGLSEQDNAFTHFQRAGAKLALGEGDAAEETRSLIESWIRDKTLDEKRAGELVERNREAFEILGRGLACQEGEDPRAVAEFASNLTDLHTLASLKVVGSRLLARRGDAAGATAGLLDALRLGDLVSGSGTFIHYILGSWLKRLALEELRASPPREAEALRAALRLLVACGNYDERIVVALKREYQWEARIIEQVARGEADPITGPAKDPPGVTSYLAPLIVKVNKTKRKLAEHMRRIIAHVGRPFAAIDEAAHEKPEVPSFLARLLSGNLGGEALLPLLMGGMNAPGVIAKHCELAAHGAATRALLAVRLHEVEKGKLPETLAELVPACLDAVPQDPFDGKPLRYDPARRIVYSVGADLEDGGGDAAEDLVFKLEP